MPVERVFLNDGDPVVQASGEYRGTVNVEFTSGRVVQKNLRAPDEDAWSELILGIEAKTLQEVQEEDAQANIGDSEIEANGEASIEQRALAYLRDAMEQEQAFDAYVRFARFNNFRTDRGWSWNQVVAGLASAGLEEEEFNEMRTAYQYLSGGGRPAIMADARTIQENWEGQ